MVDGVGHRKGASGSEPHRRARRCKAASDTRHRFVLATNQTSPDSHNTAFRRASSDAARLSNHQSAIIAARWISMPEANRRPARDAIPNVSPNGIVRRFYGYTHK